MRSLSRVPLVGARDTRSIHRRVISRIDGLAQEPRSSGSRKLQGEQNLWRIRIGDYRVIYSIDDRERIVDIVRIRHRREVYR